MLSFKDRETILHVLISPCRDYCSSFFTYPNRKTVDRLQIVQNSAARLLTRINRFEHITLVLASLHWLLVCFRIDFKVILITYKTLNGLTPQYISDLLSRYDSARTLRSSGRNLLSVANSRLKTKGDRAFEIRALRLWNTLPVEIWEAMSVTSFKSILKTYFYRTAFPEFIR